MKDFLKEIIRLWWVEGGAEITNPKSEASIKALRTILREDLDFPNVAIEYIIENIKPTTTHFASDTTSSGINVGKNQSAVSAKLHPDWDDEEEQEDDSDLNEAEAFSAIKKDTKNRTDFGSKEAKDAAIAAGTHTDINKDTADAEEDDSSEEETPEEKSAREKAEAEAAEPEFDKSAQVDMMTAKEKDAVKSNDNSLDKGDTPKEQSNGYVGDKDKTLNQGDPRESDVYQQELPPDDNEFAEKNKKYANPIPPDPYKIPDFLNDNPKFPKKYVKALERMMNTRPTGDATKWGHFSDIEGGAGQISAQAGELMTMMGTTMNDKDWGEFSNSILKHDGEFNKANPKLKKSKHKIVDKTWVKAATQSRNAIKDRLTAQYGEGVEIVAGAWDNKSDVEAMGMDDYSENKGFSTDMYLKVKLPNGEEILDEISLKKSTKVNFLNSGAGEFAKWDKNLPDEINQSVYKTKARRRNIDFVTNNKAEVEAFIKSDKGTLIRKLMEKKGVSFEEALEGNSRNKQNILFQSIKEMGKSGNNAAGELIIADDKAHRKFQSDSVKAITENPKMKEGMLNTIKNEFPLKAVSDGEETMAIGPNSLDKSTMKAIFGTDDYSKLKENLVAENGPPPFIGYKIVSSGEIFAIADIVIREDGRGYGGQFKFEMQLNQKSFAKRLEQAQSDVYGKD